MIFYYILPCEKLIVNYHTLIHKLFVDIFLTKRYNIIIGNINRLFAFMKGYL